ncbi:anhydro-N-acetylmuramic acid kinase [Oceaniserpentilla sp. 4NH20-0058]|uniref:anhydro-N-acetylmuramic acid kinase n=1 Tax=Oceaniserpentilla sp. 4NH20-0058 TaxID=3127660 RepID=UPI0031093E83
MVIILHQDDPCYYIGQMSGTSLDGIDTVLIRISGGNIELIDSLHQQFPNTIQQNIMALCHGTQDELDLSARVSKQLSELYAKGVNELLIHSGVKANQISAIGCHGQTVRHMPPHYTVQLINGSVLAELTGINVVCDFRARDMAAGGQGAPLVPAFHQQVFQQSDKDTVVVNIGGMANITFLPQTGKVGGFDTGPGNVLMDAWFLKHHKGHYDHNGQWAQSGSVNKTLLQQLLDDPYFKLPAPKSTGREHFNLQWLMQFPISSIANEDVQATLLQLTSRSIVQEIKRLTPSAEVVICGGGAFNGQLLKCLSHDLGADYHVCRSAKMGIDPQWVEAMAFAWLAQQNMLGLGGNVPDVTGAKGMRVLGALYPA